MEEREGQEGFYRAWSFPVLSRKGMVLERIWQILPKVEREVKMKEMKYIVMHSDVTGEELFIFPKSINHVDFFESVYRTKFYPSDSLDWIRPFQKIISAGFTDGKTCYGRSQSLGISSRKEDSDLL